MNRLPLAFHPLVDDDLRLGSKVERIKYHNDTDRLTLSWRGNYTEPTLTSASFDYAVISAPFTVVKRLRLPPLPYAITNAISTLPYSTACKVALEYRTRFWEKFDRPIYGSCSSSTDIPGIGSICYPSYNINGTGPASLLASYEFSADWTAVPEEQHVQYVVDAMIEIHGEVAREEYTGKYSRKCWTLDEFTGGGGWASPAVGNHEVYLPEYFKVHSKVSIGLLLFWLCEMRLTAFLSSSLWENIPRSRTPGYRPRWSLVSVEASSFCSVSLTTMMKGLRSC